MDLLDEWLEELIITDKKVEEERIKMEAYLALPTPVVELIFVTCVYFEQPDEVRYLAVELFDRFIRLHFEDLLKKAWTKNKTSAQEHWKKVEKKLGTQTSLRMLSCIQVASKFIIQPKVVKPKDIQKYLELEGKNFKLSMIMASEIRVLNTLDFKLHFPTVFTNVGMLLEQIWSSEHAHILPKDVYQTALLLTDVVYLHHQEIFCKLFYLMTGRWDVIPEEKQKFQKTECNMLYQAAAVVALAVSFTSTDVDELIHQELSNLTNLSLGDIRGLVKIINQIVLS